MKKNILMLTALFAFAQSSIADNVYSIYLESPELVAGDTIAIEHLDMILETVRSVSRSVAVEDGHVLIKDTITEFSELTLKCLGKTSDGLTIYVEPGQHLTLNIPNLKYMDESVPEGGFYSDKTIHDYFLFEADKEKILNPARAKLDYYMTTGNSDSIGMAIDRVMDIQKGTRDEWKYRRSFWYSKDCPIAAYLFAKELGFDNIRSRRVERHWRRLSPGVKQTSAGKWYRRIVDIRKSLRKKSVATNFKLTYTDGSCVSLDNLRGKYVLLYNWGVCGYVIESAPDLIALHEKYKDKLEIIALTDSGTYSLFTSKNNEDPSLQPLYRLAEQDWKTALTDRSDNEQIKRDYLMSFTPCVVLISPEGRIIRWGTAEVLKTAAKRLRRK